MANAIITGATKGIGKAIAERFLEAGMDIVICSRNQDELNTFQQQCKEKYPNAKVFVKLADMSKKEEVLAFSSFAIESLGDIDILVNNAGIFIPGAIQEESDGALESMMETNLYSAYYLTKALLPAMMNRQKGHIFNMCSIASKIAYPNGGSYSISKFALLGFTKVLREELKSSNISVTAIMPGATWSNSWAGVDLPANRLMQANDIAKTVYNAWEISPSAVVEEIIIRPQLGDL